MGRIQRKGEGRGKGGGIGEAKELCPRGVGGRGYLCPPRCPVSRSDTGHREGRGEAGTATLNAGARGWQLPDEPCGKCHERLPDGSPPMDDFNVPPLQLGHWDTLGGNGGLGCSLARFCLRCWHLRFLSSYPGASTVSLSTTWGVVFRGKRHCGQRFPVQV